MTGHGRVSRLGRIAIMLATWFAFACRQNPDRPGTASAQVAQASAAASASSPAPASRPRSDNVAYYPVGTRPRALTAGDFTGDGHVDVAVANGGAATITLLTGDGSGTLHAARTFASGNEPSDIAAADLDRDGDLDLGVTNHETPSVTVLLNDGSGAFVPAKGSPYNTGARPHVHGLVIGDFDGDGWSDIAVESADSREVRILRGGATGFGIVAAVPVATMPYTSLGAGAVSGTDGTVILVPGHGDSTIRGLQQGASGFQLAPWTVRLTNTPWMVMGGDIDNDGRGDLVAVQTDGLSVWLGGGRGFTKAAGSPWTIAGATEVAVGDLDGDKADDLAVSPWDGSDLIILTRAAQMRSSVRMCERPVGLAIADLDRDGRSEVITTCMTSDRIAVRTVFPR